jgi:DNA-binding FadR family transcriptional regulator
LNQLMSPTKPKSESNSEKIPLIDSTDTLAAIGPVARQSVVDAVADRLRGEILSERIPAGSRLPSERELSLALGVNRLTLRAALARLEALGLVSTKHGAGTEVASWRERAGLDALATLIGSLEPGEPAWHELLTSMMEVRRILAAEALALAAERRTEDDLAQMRAIADGQRAHLGEKDIITFARNDIAFQRVVVRAARNVGLELMLNTFARIPEEHPRLIEVLYDRREESLAFYDVLIELVRAGDGEAARNVARQAFAAIDEDWQRRHGRTAANAAGSVLASKRPAPKAPAKKKK